MHAILLAAGFGTRLKPITDYLPKCMAPIKDYPLLEYWLALLNQPAIDRIFINTHYHHEIVAAYIEASSHKHRVTLYYEEQLLGTAGTVKHIIEREAISVTQEAPLLVIHADNLSFFKLEMFINAHIDAHKKRPKQTALTMMAFDTTQPEQCGILEVDDQGVLIRFHEKVKNPPGNLANGAIYLMGKEAIERIKAFKNSQYDLSVDLIPTLLDNIHVWKNTIYHRDIGNPRSLAIAQSAPNHTAPQLEPNQYWSTLYRPLKAGIDQRLLSELEGLSRSNNETSSDTGVSQP